MKFKRKTTYITSEDSNLGPIDYNRFDACNLLMDVVMNMVYSVFALVNYILDMGVFIMYDNGCALQMKYLHHLVRSTLYNNICSLKLPFAVMSLFYCPPLTDRKFVSII